MEVYVVIKADNEVLGAFTDEEVAQGICDASHKKMYGEEADRVSSLVNVHTVELDRISKDEEL